MHFSIICSLIVLAGFSMAEPDPYFQYPPIHQYPDFRSGIPFSTLTDTVDSQQKLEAEARFYFATVTLTLSTVTSTSTSTVTTTCTSSTAALLSCVSGRRRRFADKQGLFYDEESSIFLPIPAEPEK